MSSSTIKDIKYDPAKKELEVTFHSGGTYRYHGVEPEAHEAFKSADSLGSHFHANIKTKYKTVKL